MSCQASTSSALAPSPGSGHNRPTRLATAAREHATQRTSTLDHEMRNCLEIIHRSIQLAPSLDRGIRLPEVLAIVGVSKSTWYARLNARSPFHDPRAPKPFKLGASVRSPSVWWHSAVMAYVDACASAQAANDGAAA